MSETDLSLSEYAVLSLLAEGPSHGFAIARELRLHNPVGRVLTVRRSLAYRALDRLVALALAEPVHTEPGDSGPQRVVHRVTAEGRRSLNRWLRLPVGHIRDMRIEFQLKLTLLQRAGRSPLPLIERQRAQLQPTLTALNHQSGLDQQNEVPIDHLELWRRHNAKAAAAFLADLEQAYRSIDP